MKNKKAASSAQTKKNIKETKRDNLKSSNNKGYEDNSTMQKSEMAKLLKIVLIVTGIMIIFYGVTLLATKKSEEVLNEQNDNNETASETTIQYDNIMIGTMLNHSGTYYVLIEMEDDNRIAEYDSIINTIKSSEDAPAIYTANLTDSFNKTYLGKEQNCYTDDLSTFKVTGTTLIKVKDGKVNSVYDQHNDIKNTLNDLA